MQALSPQASFTLPSGVVYQPWSDIAPQPQEPFNQEWNGQGLDVSYAFLDEQTPWEVPLELPADPLDIAWNEGWVKFDRDMATRNKWDRAGQLESACQVPRNQLPFRIEKPQRGF